jgi:hypothetical protein
MVERWCRPRHRVRTIHGTVPYPFGTEAGFSLRRLRSALWSRCAPATE